MKLMGCFKLWHPSSSAIADVTALKASPSALPQSILAICLHSSHRGAQIPGNYREPPPNGAYNSTRQLYPFTRRPQNNSKIVDQ